MSYQYPGQYVPKELTFDDVTEIFLKNFWLHVFAAGFGASIAFAEHSFLLSSGVDSDMANIVAAMFYAIVFVILFLLVAGSAWKNMRDSREIAFLVDRIKQKYDTTGMTFNDRFRYYRTVIGKRTPPDGSQSVGLMFTFHSQTYEPIFLGSFGGPSFFPSPAPNIYSD